MDRHAAAGEAGRGRRSRQRHRADADAGQRRVRALGVPVVVFTLIWWIDDDVASGQWMTVVTALSFGYFISRGVAKASRVLEQ